MSDTQSELEELLASLGESSAFVAAGSMPPVLPGLTVAGIGSVGFPVSEAEACRLIEKATQAPYGHGEQTIVDTNVRRVWQIEPARFTLENPAWKAHIDAIVGAVTHEFGIGQKVKADLYKLLVYEPGSFFAPHRDTEKLKNMFATLVVCLPSRHEGGTLVVEHDGQTKRIDFAGGEGAFNTQYAAFYADCRHEVQPVTSGYRVCLVYNLSMANRNNPEPPQYAAATAHIAQLLSDLFADPASAPSKIAIPFQHQYSESGLDPTQLKGADRTRATVLTQAAEALDYICHFALATHWQAGYPDDSMLYERDRRRSRRSKEGADDKVEMEEVTDESLSLDHWVDSRGIPVAFGEIGLDEDEILSASGTKNWSFRQEIEEATGNEGTSMEHWYRQGAVVLWPRHHTFGILASQGQRTAIPELERMAAGATSRVEWDACLEFAAAIVTGWDASQRALRAEASYTGRMLRLLEQLDAPELALRFVVEVLPKSFDGSEGSSLVNICERSGWTPFGAALHELVATQRPGAGNVGLRAIVDLCRALCSDPPPLNDERHLICQKIGNALADAIRLWDKPKKQALDDDDDDDDDVVSEKFHSLYGLDNRARLGVVEGTVRVFTAIAAETHLGWFVKHLLNDPDHYDLHAVLIPDLKAMHTWSADFSPARQVVHELLNHCVAELSAATAEPVKAPVDWARAADLGCDCPDCLILTRFLRDTKAQTARFPVRKDRRQHLHRQIDQHRCDCTHVTERQGSPQTLVCVKTDASYQRRLAQYKVDRALIAELESLDVEAPVNPVHTADGRTVSRKK